MVKRAFIGFGIFAILIPTILVIICIAIVAVVVLKLSKQKRSKSPHISVATKSATPAHTNPIPISSGLPPPPPPPLPPHMMNGGTYRSSPAYPSTQGIGLESAHASHCSYPMNPNPSVGFNNNCPYPA